MLKQPVGVSILLAIMVLNAHGAVLIERTEADLGFIYRDEPQTLVFEFENASGDTLHMLGIEPSCDCTTAQVVPDVIVPQAGAKILVFFDPMGYEGRGQFTEYVRITTTDIETPEILITFSAEVGIGPEAEPRSLSFGKICRGESDTLGFYVHPVPGTALDVYDAYSDTACILVEQLGVDPGGTHQFRVIAANMGGCGRVATFVTVVTSDLLRDEIRIPLTVSLVGRIIVEPDIIAFGATLPGTFVAQAVKVYSKDGKKFGVPEIACSVEQLEPSITPVTDDSCELRLKVRDDASPGRVTGTIILKTDCPDEPPIEIEVTGYIRSAR
jgi:hypothetical protein